jgi:hypothetical protein
MNHSELYLLYLASSYDAAESSSSFICTVESTKLLWNKKDEIASSKYKNTGLLN